MAPGSFMHVAAEHFDFFTVVDGGGFDFFGTGIAEEAQTDGGDVALMFMPGEEELVVPWRMRSRASPFWILFCSSLLLMRS